MTKRYFYTDPLSAAWQAKHFGMCFVAKARARGLTHAVLRIAGSANRLFEIHPDSLPLLDPQVGDILRLYFFTPKEDDKAGAVMTGFYAGGREAITWFRDPRDGGIDKQLHRIEDHQWRIIQRKGLAFHHPECEEANG